MAMLNLVVYGVPFSKQSARHRAFLGRKGQVISQVYQSKSVKQNEYNFRAQVVEQLPPEFITWDGNIVIVKLLFVFPFTSSISQKKRKEVKENGRIIYKNTKPDITDNLMKGVFDAMEGVVYTNDSRIVRIENVTKVYGDRPRTEMILKEQ